MSKNNCMSLSRQDVASLSKLLAKINVSPAASSKPKGGRRRRARGRNRDAGSAPLAASRPTNPSGRGPNSGEVMVQRTELLSAVTVTGTVTSGFINLAPSTTVLSWLQKVFVAFERIEWVHATLLYKPFVSASTSGSIAVGFDWDSTVASAASVTRATVQASTPVYESPVWQNGRVTLPKKMLMTRRYYSKVGSESIDVQPCQVIWATAGASAATIGELWLEYKVKLSGTSA